MDRIYELTPVPTFVLDPFLRIVRASNSLLQHLSVTSDKCVGQDLYDCLETLLGLTQWWPVHEAIQQATTDRRLTTVPQIKNLYGNVYHFRIVPIFEDQLLHVVVEIEVTSVSKQPSTSPEIPYADIQDIFEALDQHAIFKLGMSGQIQTWSAAARLLTGYAKEDVVGRHHSILYQDSIEEKRFLYGLITASAESSQQREAWICRKDGSRFLAEITMSPTPKQCLVVTVNDITSRHAEKIKRSAQDAEEMEKRQIIGKNSQTVLTSLQDAALKLKASTLDEEQLLLLEKIDECKLSLASNIHSLLDIDNPEAINVSALIKETLKAHSATMLPNIQYKHDIASKIPAHLVGPREAFRSVLNLLLTTAVRVTKSGGIQVKAVATEETSETCEVRVSVFAQGNLDTYSYLEKDGISSFFESPSTKSQRLRKRSTGVADMTSLMQGSYGHYQNPVGEGNISWFTCRFALQKSKGPSLRTESSVIKVLLMQKDATSQRQITALLRRLGVTKIDITADEETMVSYVKKTSEPYDIAFVDFDSDEIAATTAVDKLRQLKVKVPPVVPVASKWKAPGLKEKGFQTIVTKVISKADLKAALDNLPRPGFDLAIREKVMDVEDIKDSDWVEI